MGKLFLLKCSNWERKVGSSFKENCSDCFKTLVSDGLVEVYFKKLKKKNKNKTGGDLEVKYFDHVEKFVCMTL